MFRYNQNSCYFFIISAVLVNFFSIILSYIPAFLSGFVYMLWVFVLLL